MNSRPIIFDAESVRAILAGEKSQTRRVVKPQFGKKWGQGVTNQWPAFYSVNVDIPDAQGAWRWLHCPYGKPGDELWVRETFCQRWNDPPTQNGYWDGYWYAATDPQPVRVDGDGWTVFRKNGVEASPWVSPMRMPREASRITLRVTGVRIELLQSITGEDARAEGVKYPVAESSVPGKVAPLFQVPDGHRRADDWGIVGKGSRTATHDDLSRLEYSLRWDAINGKRGFGWDVNPWVFVVSFVCIKPEGVLVK